MSQRKWFAALGAVALVMAVPVSARAQAAPTLMFSSGNAGHPRQVESVSGGGLAADVGVRLTFDDRTLATTTTNNTGTWSTTFVVPSGALPGNHRVSAVSHAAKVNRQFLVRTNWLASGFGPRHSGFNPYENVLSVENVVSLQQEWATSPNPSGDNVAELGEAALVNGVIYTSDYDSSNPDGLNYAINATNGQVLWARGLGNFAGTPAVVDGTVYTVSEEGTLYAQDTSTGAIEWSMTSPGSIIGANNGILYTTGPAAIDLATHEVLWKGEIGDGGGAAYDPQEGIIVYGGSDGAIHAVDAATGDEEWSYSNGSDVPNSAVPSMSDGVVYVNVGGDSPDLVALNETDGSLIWDDPDVYILGGAPAVADGMVFIESDGNVVALNATTGAILWTAEGAGGVGANGADAPIVVANGVVYAMPFTTIEETTGQILSKSYAASHGSIIVANGNVYLNSGNTTLAEYSS